MNEESFNLGIRRFLKRFGITAQREIERAVAEALKSGQLQDEELLQVQATLSIPGLLPSVRIEGEIPLTQPDEPTA